MSLLGRCGITGVYFHWCCLGAQIDLGPGLKLKTQSAASAGIQHLNINTSTSFHSEREPAQVVLKLLPLSTNHLLI